jgi:hypothetical protein
MERTIELNAHEREQIATLEKEHMQINAQWAVLRRQMDAVEKLVAQSEEAQRGFIRAALSQRGVSQIQSARLEQGIIRYATSDDRPRHAGNSEVAEMTDQWAKDAAAEPDSNAGGEAFARMMRRATDRAKGIPEKIDNK